MKFLIFHGTTRFGLFWPSTGAYSLRKHFVTELLLWIHVASCVSNKWARFIFIYNFCSKHVFAPKDISADTLVGLHVQCLVRRLIICECADKS
jgi:hypothetical protein